MAKSERRGAQELDEIYLGDYDGFVARRNALAKRLRADGESDTAKRVQERRKPSRAAWALNQLSARRPKLRDELLEAGTALREAQERVVAGEAGATVLKAVAEQERAAVDRALEAAAALAEKEGAGLSPTALERARRTLHAVALDEDVRRDFERHRLEADHEAAGIGGLAIGAAPRRQKAERSREELKAAEADARELEQRERRAERDVQAAREAAEQAQQDLKRAIRELEKAACEAQEARSRADELRGR